MTDNFNLKKYLAENKLLKEVDLSSEVDQYTKDTPFTRDNEFSGEFKIKKQIQDKIGRPLTPKEKGAITRIYNKALRKYWVDRFREKSNDEDKSAINRYKNNLLPLKTDNGNGKPDSTYYELANTYYDTDRDFNTRISHNDPISGYTDYRIKDKWIDTPVNKTTLDRYWTENILRYIGWYSQE